MTVTVGLISVGVLKGGQGRTEESQVGYDDDEDDVLLQVSSSSECQTSPIPESSSTKPQVSASGYSPIDLAAAAVQKAPSVQSLSAEKHVSFDISHPVSTDETIR